jgi:hypothetical protein
MQDNNEHRKFLHELANVLTILKANIRKVQKEFEAPEAHEIDRALCVQRLTKAMETMSRIEDLHASYYQVIRKEAA